MLRRLWRNTAIGALFFSAPIAVLLGGSLWRGIAWAAIGGLYAIAAALESRRR